LHVLNKCFARRKASVARAQQVLARTAAGGHRGMGCKAPDNMDVSRPGRGRKVSKSTKKWSEKIR